MPAGLKCGPAAAGTHERAVASRQSAQRRASSPATRRRRLEPALPQRGSGEKRSHSPIELPVRPHPWTGSRWWCHPAADAGRGRAQARRQARRAGGANDRGRRENVYLVDVEAVVARRQAGDLTSDGGPCDSAGRASRLVRKWPSLRREGCAPAAVSSKFTVPETPAVPVRTTTACGRMTGSENINFTVQKNKKTFTFGIFKFCVSVLVAFAVEDDLPAFPLQSWLHTATLVRLRPSLEYKVARIHYHANGTAASGTRGASRRQCSRPADSGAPQNPVQAERYHQGTHGFRALYSKRSLASAPKKTLPPACLLGGGAP